MRLAPTAIAFALASLPVAANAQSIVRGAVGAHEFAAAASESAAIAPLPVAVALTRPGVFATEAETLAADLAIVDERQVDVDGDGDLDALILADATDDGEAPKPEGGRGVVVAYREANGWRGVTVASLPYAPLEAAFNWGTVDALRAGLPPLLHVRYSQATVGAPARQGDTVVMFDGGSLRPVYTASVESVAVERGDGVIRSLAVEARDVNGDGTAELLERVESRRCTDEACFASHPSGASSVARRTLRWDGVARRFVPSDARPDAPRTARADVPTRP